MEIQINHFNIIVLTIIIIFATIGLIVEVHTARLLGRVVKPVSNERNLISTPITAKDDNMNSSAYQIVTLGNGKWDYFVFANAMFPVSNVAAITALSNNDFHVFLYASGTPIVVTGLTPVTPTPAATAPPIESA
jgi:hypothetical protein